MKIIELMCNHMTNPLGFGLDRAVLSYQFSEVTTDSSLMTRILVSQSKDFQTILFDSGEREDINCAAYELPIKLKSRTRYYWKVEAFMNHKRLAESETAWFETAKGKKEPWNGVYITQPFSQNIHPVFCRTIAIAKEIEQARIYVLGLGVYEMYLNGSKVGEECLLPGIYAYDKWLQYQTFELNLITGENHLEICLGDGWFKGEYSIASQKLDLSAKFTLLAEIRIGYKDGTEEIIGSDESWMVKKGKVIFDSIYNGEIYDSRVKEEKEYPAILLASIAGGSMERFETSRLIPRLSPPIRIQERIKPVLLVTKKQEYVLDMQQNMVGWLEFFCDAPKDTTIHMQFGELLQDGCFYRDNLRTAKCEFTYISDGKPKLVRQHFTFYGFRYVKLEGFSNPINANDFTGCVIYSDMKHIGHISTDNSLVNRLISNIEWGHKGNFLDTATDCPQRDERMGWTGDAQVFSDTACFHRDTYAFYTKYLHDLWEEQKKQGGSVPHTVPCSRYNLSGSSGWGDCATVIPWTMYLHYGDKAILQRQYGSMKAWVEYMHREDIADGNSHLWKTGHHFGDWLALDGAVAGGVYGATDQYLISSAYYYYSTMLTSKAAGVIGKHKECERYLKLALQIKEAFLMEYFTGNGRLSVDTQTAYALVIVMGLYPKEHEQRVFQDFRNKMHACQFKLKTGFIGTPFLCHALTISKNTDVAYSLLLNEEYPGWLYEVNMGATTVWERWNSVLPDGRISGTEMNSLNHYAYGAILSWLYRDVLGINPMEENPGFKIAYIAPHPDARLKSITGELQSPYGIYKVSWKLEMTGFRLKLHVPYDCKAYVEFPKAVYYNQVNIQKKKKGSCKLIKKEGNVIGICTYGEYEFLVTSNESYQHFLSTEDTVKVLTDNESTRKVIEKYYPNYLKGIPFELESKSMKELLNSPFLPYSKEKTNSFERELRECQTDRRV